MKQNDPDNREFLVERLLDAGVDISIEDKHGNKPIHYLDLSDEKILKRFQDSEASAQFEDNGGEDGDEDDKVNSENEH